jgi:heavy metal sensor kinase
LHPVRHVNPRSLAFRLSAWYALILSATFTIVGIGVFYGLSQYLRSELRESAERRSQQIEQLLLRSGVGVSDAAIAADVSTRLAPEYNNRYVRVTRAPSVVAYRSGAPADQSFDPAGVPAPQLPWSAKRQVHSLSTGSGDLLIVATPLEAPSGRYLIELGYSLTPLQIAERRLLTLLALMLPVLVLCATVGGYLLVQRALRPVEQMSDTARQISVQDLEARLPVVNSGDALQRLSVSLNHMLARLRDSVQISRRFLADASHELRTPLTIIKGELQELVADDDCAPALAERVGSVLEEVARLEHLVSGLLMLSRLDTGDAQREWLDVDLAELAGLTAEQMRLIAEDRGVSLQTARLEPLTVRGDRNRLKQVIVNLLDNAIKFTPRGGRVALTTGTFDGCGVLEIQDTGFGIAPEAVPHIFDRFYRADEARSREVGGAGLGLSIVHAICTAHGADIQVQSRQGEHGGSLFRLRFPLHTGA